MTRNERRGAVALLAAIALSLILVVTIRNHRESVPTVAVQQESVSSDVAADSLVRPTVKPEHQEPKQERTLKRKRPKTAKPQPEREPRRLDPVPGF